jgi:hypothetical protein
MRIAPTRGAPFGGLANRLDQAPIGPIENIRHRTARQTVAVMQHLLDLDRGDQGGAGKVLPRHIVLDRHRLDVEASRFHHPDYLGPADKRRLENVVRRR